MASPFTGRVTALVLAAALTVTGCSGDDEPGAPGEDPAQVIAEAQEKLDETSGVRITLETDEVPNGVSAGIKSATGVGVHPSAFEGDFELIVSGFAAQAQVIAVDGVTYAKNTLLLPDWTEIDPADYSAPDPARLMEPGTGFSGLLAAFTDVEEGESVRGGEDNKEIFTEYTGTLPASAVETLIPSATGDFDAVLTVSDAGELRRAEITGVFYDGADPLTYTLTLDDYGTTQEIVAP
jgi:lipoprotein LprG